MDIASFVEFSFTKKNERVIIKHSLPVIYFTLIDAAELLRKLIKIE